jgi:hypothetical protein
MDTGFGLMPWCIPGASLRLQVAESLIIFGDFSPDNFLQHQERHMIFSREFRELPRPRVCIERVDTTGEVGVPDICGP